MSPAKHPQKLGAAIAGNPDWSHVIYQNGRAAAQLDPVELRLDNVAPDCILQIVNLSVHPAPDWARHARAIPRSRLCAAPDGTFTLRFGQADAERLSVLPGDVFEIRQIDAAGNASEPTEIVPSRCARRQAAG